MSQIQYLFDENCNARIMRGARRRASQLHLITVQETGLEGATDAEILAFAAAEGLVVVSHDVKTMTACATARLHTEQPMAGLILITQEYPVGQAIDDLVLIAEVSTPEEWQGKMVFLPL